MAIQVTQTQKGVQKNQALEILGNFFINGKNYFRKGSPSLKKNILKIIMVLYYKIRKFLSKT